MDALTQYIQATGVMEHPKTASFAKASHSLPLPLMLSTVRNPSPFSPLGGIHQACMETHPRMDLAGATSRREHDEV